MAPITLKKRREFLRVRGGKRFSTSAFLLEGKPRTPAQAQGNQPRFGFIVTKKMGGAVVRNRMRRRLKAAIAELAPGLADPTFDYAVLARPPALDRAYDKILADLKRAFERLHSPEGKSAEHRSRQKSSLQRHGAGRERHQSNRNP